MVHLVRAKVYIILTVFLVSWIEFILSVMSRSVANISSGAADMASNGAKICQHGQHRAQCNRHGEADTPWGRQFILGNTLGKKTFFSKELKKWSSNQINRKHLVTFWGVRNITLISFFEGSPYTEFTVSVCVRFLDKELDNNDSY